jgi:putative peptide zinc metalloprotease protein
MLFKPLHQISATSVVICVAAIIFASFFHELGHCAAVAAFGARVRRIGFGIYWLSPALFSDVSAAWTLTRWERVAVDCGGIYFQLLACAFYALAAVFATSQAIQLAFQVAIVANLVAVISALNPILKYDGYWIVSDAMSIPNLRRQSELAIRNFTRRLVTGRGRRNPSGQTDRFLLSYGVFSLLYSAALFFVFAIVIRHNVMLAVRFPKEAWTFFVTGLSTGNISAQCAHLALDFLRVIPVACAPIALLTATGAVAGFLKRAFSEAD